ncbi:serine hydrolase domain-containing protein [Pedobacter sp. SL55]|uniref:serine hydrolase domain-containing protein n=1 Tax=Pedobacter sp. SL55 TaxID=2995161 RepID=UPI002271A218|nr:serine hydrolase domain-containing protein [Pedobacter sp. SL55]WAC40397.1 serine hydrolase [Pedobacter sp. SL55]
MPNTLKSYFIAALFIVYLPIAASAQTATELKELDNIFQNFNSGSRAPGGVITVGKNGNVFFNKAAGSADLEHEIANTPETRFEAGSVSKQFTSTAVLLLIESNKVGLEDEVRKYIPELPDYGKPLLVKHLLLHTSGLKDWGSIYAITGWPRGTKAYTQDDARAMIFKQKTLNFLPGEAYSYSNSNFTLLATLVEKVSGMSFNEFTKQNIFIPIGMNDTQWRDNFRAIVKNRAIGYQASGKDYLQDMPFENTHGHGGLITTTTDMQKWLNYWNENKFGKKLTELRNTQGILNNGQQIEYALGGVFVKKFNGLTEISHSGLTAGYRGWMAWYPEKGITVTCLSNGATLPSSQIKDVFLGKEASKTGKRGSALPQNLIDQLPGLYKSVRGYSTLEIVKKENRIFMKTGAEVLALNGDTLTTGSRKIYPERDARKFLSIIGTDTLSFVKIERKDLNAAELNKYIGNYYSRECDTKIEGVLKGQQLFALRNAEPPIKLQPVYNGVFNMAGILLDFNSPTNNSGFSANVDRAQQVIFDKTKP